MAVNRDSVVLLKRITLLNKYSGWVFFLRKATFVITTETMQTTMAVQRFGVLLNHPNEQWHLPRPFMAAKNLMETILFN